MHKLKKFIALSMALLTAATMNRLPVVVRAGSEFEEVGRKPLGDGFTGVPVREFHLSRAIFSRRSDRLSHELGHHSGIWRSDGRDSTCRGKSRTRLARPKSPLPDLT
jgi:hypothetical protein